MEFSPSNPVVKLCLQGMAMEELGKPEEASQLFLKAWNEATDDFEKFTAAYYVARHQQNVSDRLKWYEITLQYALQLNDDAVKAAFPSLYTHIAQCYEELGGIGDAKKNHELAISFPHNPSDKGPFYHGTRADLEVGDLLTAGRTSNYQSEVVMNHIYFTAVVNGAGLAAGLAKGDGCERVYIVEPTGTLNMTQTLPIKNFRVIRPVLIERRSL